MLESDADRLASIKGLGGQLVLVAGVEILAIFDAAGVQSQFEDTHINSTSPRLTLRTSDAKANALDRRGTAVTIDGVEYTTREHLPGDAPGWSLVILNSI